MLDKNEVAEAYRKLQDAICAGIEQLDGSGNFIEDSWERPGGGGGRSRIITHGALIEKGGVNFSEVKGELPDEIAREYGSAVNSFFATGVSIVLHPINPFVPIIHMNVRYFEMGDGLCWFGGGIDLTPHYIDPADAQSFHAGLKQICDQFHPDFYDEHSQWADKYFYIKHRNETRGIGGVFFDRLKPGNPISGERIFEYTLALGNAFVALYSQVANRHRGRDYKERHKIWQKLRRGRYVEFNLVWDKGTRFGLLTSGRTESILMSLPVEAMWLYDFHPEPGSEEEKTLKYLQHHQSWLN